MINDFSKIPGDSELRETVTVKELCEHNNMIWHDSCKDWQCADCESFSSNWNKEQDTPLGQQYGDGFDEYNDPDATACANGDYNTFEENQCFLDNE